MLSKYDSFPEFRALNDLEEEISSSQFLGSYTILYFYPKAFTPGCTKECNSFSDNIDQFISFKMDDLKENFIDNEQKLSKIELPAVGIVGISPDEVEKLAEFKEKYKLKVNLLSDFKKEIAKDFAALKDNGGILRSTFILDPWNRVRKSWYGVKVKGHVEEVLSSLKEIVSEDIKINPQIIERRAKRSFNENRQVSDVMIKQLMKAAHLAPSCFNNQPWRFSVVDDKEKLQQLAEYIPSGNYWLKKAPVLIAVYSKSENDCQLSGNRDYFLFDTGLAVGNLLIQATQMGLIAHPVAGYDPLGFKEILNIPEDNVLITIIGIGFPADVDYLNEKHKIIESSPRGRIDMEEILNWNAYSKS